MQKFSFKFIPKCTGILNTGISLVLPPPHPAIPFPVYLSIWYCLLGKQLGLGLEKPSSATDWSGLPAWLPYTLFPSMVTMRELSLGDLVENWWQTGKGKKTGQMALSPPPAWCYERSSVSLQMPLCSIYSLSPSSDCLTNSCLFLKRLLLFYSFFKSRDPFLSGQLIPSLDSAHTSKVTTGPG